MELIKDPCPQPLNLKFRPKFFQSVRVCAARSFPFPRYLKNNLWAAKDKLAQNLKLNFFYIVCAIFVLVYFGFSFIFATPVSSEIFKLKSG